MILPLSNAVRACLAPLQGLAVFWIGQVTWIEPAVVVARLWRHTACFALLAPMGVRNPGVAEHMRITTADPGSGLLPGILDGREGADAEAGVSGAGTSLLAREELAAALGLQVIRPVQLAAIHGRWAVAGSPLGLEYPQRAAAGIAGGALVAATKRRDAGIVGTGHPDIGHEWKVRAVVGYTHEIPPGQVGTVI